MSTKQMAPVRSRKARETPAEKTGARSFGTFQREAKRVFAEAEAPRASKLGERFGEGFGIYLYKVEPPTQGEVDTVKARIADLRKEISAEDQDRFEKYLDWLIDSYDPYGLDGRKAFIIRVPNGKNARMSADQIIHDDIDALQKEFMNGGPNRFSVKEGWVASFDGETLDRFDHLIDLGA